MTTEETWAIILASTGMSWTLTGEITDPAAVAYFQKMIEEAAQHTTDQSDGAS